MIRDLGFFTNRAAELNRNAMYLAKLQDLADRQAAEKLPQETVEHVSHTPGIGSMVTGTIGSLALPAVLSAMKAIPHPAAQGAGWAATALPYAVQGLAGLAGLYGGSMAGEATGLNKVIDNNPGSSMAAGATALGALAMAARRKPGALPTASAPSPGVTVSSLSLPPSNAAPAAPPPVNAQSVSVNPLTGSPLRFGSTPSVFTGVHGPHAGAVAAQAYDPVLSPGPSAAVQFSDPRAVVSKVNPLTVSSVGSQVSQTPPPAAATNGPTPAEIMRVLNQRQIEQAQMARGLSQMQRQAAVSDASVASLSPAEIAARAPVQAPAPVFSGVPLPPAAASISKKKSKKR